MKHKDITKEILESFEEKFCHRNLCLYDHYSDQSCDCDYEPLKSFLKQAIDRVRKTTRKEVVGEVKEMTKSNSGIIK